MGVILTITWLVLTLSIVWTSTRISYQNTIGSNVGYFRENAPPPLHHHLRLICLFSERKDIFPISSLHQVFRKHKRKILPTQYNLVLFYVKFPFNHILGRQILRVQVYQKKWSYTHCHLACAYFINSMYFCTYFIPKQLGLKSVIFVTIPPPTSSPLASNLFFSARKNTFSPPVP